jgi:hypothetical protein
LVLGDATGDGLDKINGTVNFVVNTCHINIISLHTLLKIQNEEEYFKACGYIMDIYFDIYHCWLWKRGADQRLPLSNYKKKFGKGCDESNKK